MLPPELPDDLRSLELCLGSRPDEGPSPDLRPRTLAAMRVVLDRERMHKRFWRCAAAITAGAVVWINFATSVVNRATWLDPTRHDAEGLESLARKHFTTSLEP
jgi:hypothetical protein